MIPPITHLIAELLSLANSYNILSDLLTVTEKKTIISKAKISTGQQYWKDIVW